MPKEKKERPSDKRNAQRKPISGGSEHGNEEYSGRTVGDTASSYSSVGGPRRGRPTSSLGESGPAHQATFRPGPGGMVEESDQTGRDIPFTGDAVSTRDSTFEENPDTGLTPEEEERRLLTESLEKRTRGHESG